MLAASPSAAPFEFDFEDAQLDEQAVRDLVWEEMRWVQGTGDWVLMQLAQGLVLNKVEGTALQADAFNPNFKIRWVSTERLDTMA